MWTRPFELTGRDFRVRLTLASCFSRDRTIDLVLATPIPTYLPTSHLSSASRNRALGIGTDYSQLSSHSTTDADHRTPESISIDAEDQELYIPGIIGYSIGRDCFSLINSKIQSVSLASFLVILSRSFTISIRLSKSIISRLVVWFLGFFVLFPSSGLGSVRSERGIVGRSGRW